MAKCNVGETNLVRCDHCHFSIWRTDKLWCGHEGKDHPAFDWPVVCYQYEREPGSDDE